MILLHATRGMAAACLVVVLSACGGGGGGGDETRTSTVTLSTSTASTSVGTYSTQKSDRSTQNGGTNVGNVVLIKFDFPPAMNAAFSYSEKIPEVYVVGIGDAAGKYMCGSDLAASSGGLPRCPPDTKVDIRNKTVTFSDATLLDPDTMRSVKASGSLQWH